MPPLFRRLMVPVLAVTVTLLAASASVGAASAENVEVACMPRFSQCGSGLGAAIAESAPPTPARPTPAASAQPAPPLGAVPALEQRAAAIIVPDIELDNVPVAEAIRVLEATARKYAAQLGVPADIQIADSACQADTRVYFVAYDAPLTDVLRVLAWRCGLEAEVGPETIRIAMPPSPVTRTYTISPQHRKIICALNDSGLPGNYDLTADRFNNFCVTHCGVRNPMNVEFSPDGGSATVTGNPLDQQKVAAFLGGAAADFVQFALEARLMPVPDQQASRPPKPLAVCTIPLTACSKGTLTVPAGSGYFSGTEVTFSLSPITQSYAFGAIADVSWTSRRHGGWFQRPAGAALSGRCWIRSASGRWWCGMSVAPGEEPGEALALELALQPLTGAEQRANALEQPLFAQKIIFPNIEFQDMPIRNLLPFFRRQARLFNTEGIRPPGIIGAFSSRLERTLTISMHNVLFDEACRYCAMSIGGGYALTKSSIVIGDKEVSRHFRAWPASWPFGSEDFGETKTVKAATISAWVVECRDGKAAERLAELAISAKSFREADAARTGGVKILARHELVAMNGGFYSNTPLPGGGRSVLSGTLQRRAKNIGDRISADIAWTEADGGGPAAAPKPQWRASAVLAVGAVNLFPLPASGGHERFLVLRPYDCFIRIAPPPEQTPPELSAWRERWERMLKVRLPTFHCNTPSRKCREIPPGLPVEDEEWRKRWTAAQELAQRQVNEALAKAGIHDFRWDFCWNDCYRRCTKQDTPVVVANDGSTLADGNNWCFDVDIQDVSIEEVVAARCLAGERKVHSKWETYVVSCNTDGVLRLEELHWFSPSVAMDAGAIAAARHCAIFSSYFEESHHSDSCSGTGADAQKLETVCNILQLGRNYRLTVTPKSGGQGTALTLRDGGNADGLLPTGKKTVAVSTTLREIRRAREVEITYTVKPDVDINRPDSAPASGSLRLYTGKDAEANGLLFRMEPLDAQGRPDLSPPFERILQKTEEERQAWQATQDRYMAELKRLIIPKLVLDNALPKEAYAKLAAACREQKFPAWVGNYIVAPAISTSGDSGLKAQSFSEISNASVADILKLLGNPVTITPPFIWVGKSGLWKGNAPGLFRRGFHLPKDCAWWNEEEQADGGQDSCTETDGDRMARRFFAKHGVADASFCYVAEFELLLVRGDAAAIRRVGEVIAGHTGKPAEMVPANLPVPPPEAALPDESIPPPPPAE